MMFQPQGFHNSSGVSVRHAIALKDQNYEVVRLSDQHYSSRQQQNSQETDIDVDTNCMLPSRGGGGAGVITLGPGAKSGVILRLAHPAGMDQHLNCSLRVIAGNG